MSERRREDVDTLELLSRVTAAELRISILEAAANEPAPQEHSKAQSDERSGGTPVGAAPLPDDVAKMVERLRLVAGEGYTFAGEAADLLEKQAARIAELEKALPTCDEHKPRGGSVG